MLSFDRGAARRRLADTHFDVLVIGGGVTGAGVALDAASRGLRTALVERDDFASADPRQCTARVLRTMPAKRDEKRHDATVNALCGRCCARIARD